MGPVRRVLRGVFQRRGHHVLDLLCGDCRAVRPADFFAAMDSLRTIEGIGEVDTSQVEDMSYMFA